MKIVELCRVYEEAEKRDGASLPLAEARIAFADVLAAEKTVRARVKECMEVISRRGADGPLGVQAGSELAWFSAWLWMRDNRETRRSGWLP